MMGDIGETLMLLGLILPVVVDAVYKKLFGDDSPKGQQKSGAKTAQRNLSNIGDIERDNRIKWMEDDVKKLEEKQKIDGLTSAKIRELNNMKGALKQLKKDKLVKSKTQSLGNQESNITYKDKLLTDKENIQKSRTPTINNIQSGSSGGGSGSSSSSPKAVGARDKSYDSVTDNIKR